MALTPYAANELSGWNRGMGNIASALINAPRYRAMMQAALARAQEEELLGQEAQARTGLLKAQTGEIATGDKRIDDASASSSAYTRALQAYRDNPTPQTKADMESAADDLSGAMAEFKNVKVGDLISAIGKTGALNELAGPQPDYARAGGMQGDAARIATDAADNAQKGSRPVIIPKGGTEATPTGAILATGVNNIPSGNIVTGATTGTNAPTVIATNPKPVAPTKYNPESEALAREVIMGQGKDTDHPTGTNTITSALSQFNRAFPSTTDTNDDAETPAAPTSVPDTRGVFSRLFNIGQVPVPAPESGGEVNLTQDDLTPVTRAASPSLSGHVVRIMSPDGQTGIIPAENLATALQRGAKQIQ